MGGGMWVGNITTSQTAICDLQLLTGLCTWTWCQSCGK